MKIVCGSCGAKYSIADEKVQGRVFKIRCKKCSDVIVVKGTTDAADARDAEADYSSAYGHSGGASEWYVVIDGDQVGPITPEEVEAYYTVGQLTAESFVWREGLGDWVMINTLDEFAHLTHDTAGPNEQTMIAHHHHRDAAHDTAGDETAVIQSGQFQSAVSGGDDPTFGYGATATADAYSHAGEELGVAAGADSGYGSGGFESQTFGAGADYDSGGDSFQSFNAPASDPAPGYGAGYGSSDDSYESDGGGGMFAAFDSTPPDDSDYGGGFGGGYGEQDAGEDGPAGTANELVGARNENSVLFSLSSLDQVKAVSKPATGGDQGAAQGNDKSGLIDIQALASAHATMKSGNNAGGTDNEAFVPPSMSMPALMPMPMGSHRNNKGLIIGVSIGGAVLLVGIAAVIVLLLNNQNQQPTQIIEQVVAEQPTQAPAQVDEKAAEEAKAAAERALAESQPAESEEKEEEETAEEERAEAKTADRKTQASNTRTSGSSSSRTSSTRSSSTTREEAAPRTTRPAAKKGGIDELLGQIDTKKSNGGSTSGSSAPAAAAPAANVPEKLSRTMVQNTVRQYNGQVMRCHQTSNSGNLSGTVTVRFTVQPSGSVSAAGVQGGEFRGTDLGSCIEGVVRSMKFPASQSDLTINYPFIVR